MASTNVVPSAAPWMKERLTEARDKFLRAKRRDAQFESDVKEVEKREEQLEHEKHCLRTKRLMLRGQQSEWRRDTVWYHVFVPYSKAWNQQFAAQIQARLPREIRDMIYRYFWYFHPDRISNAEDEMARSRVRRSPLYDFPHFPDDTLVRYDYLMRLSRSMPHVDNRTLSSRFDNVDLPHFLSPDYMGMFIAHEFGVSFYPAINAANLLHCDSHNIRLVLQQDCFQLELPTIDLVKALTIHCKLDQYRTPPPDHRQAPNCKHTAIEAAQIRKNELEEHFKFLLGIKKKQDFRLHILLYQRNIRLNVLAEVIDTLEDVVKSFKQNKALVTVWWTYRGHWNDTEGPASEDLVNHDITRFFGQPKVPGYQDWEYEMYDVLHTFKDLIEARHLRVTRPLNIDRDHPKFVTPNDIVHGMYDPDEDASTTDGEEDDSEADYEYGAYLDRGSDDDDEDNTDSEGSEASCRHVGAVCNRPKTRFNIVYN